MGTPAIQRANLIAFSMPFVNGGEVGLRLHFGGHALDVSADAMLMRNLRDALCAVLPRTNKKPGRRGPKISEFTLAAYRRVAAAAAKGATWSAAARAEGVDPIKVNAWWHSARRRDARRGAGAPVTKPSGELL